MDYFSGLNEAQKKAVQETEGYVRVIAGPGSGKTRTLVHRVAYLVDTCGVSMDNILCITFTNKASFVMKHRLRQMLGESFNGNIFTFHSLCARILRNEYLAINYPKQFTILDQEDAHKIYHDLYQKYDLDKNFLSYKDLAQKIASFKDKYSTYIDYLITPLEEKMMKMKKENF